MADSLVISDTIELLGGGVISVNPACAGARFILQDPFSLDAPQPTVDLLATDALDGEFPYGTRASNRNPSLTVLIQVPPTGNGLAADRITLAAARELLMQLLDQPTFTLTWTRDPGAGGTPLPMVLDCYRAAPAQVQYDNTREKALSVVVTVTFQAQPYGRTDEALFIPVASPVAGASAPPSAVVIDPFTTVTGAQWTQATAAVVGPKSARWNPASAPLSTPKGSASVPATYTRSGIGPFNITGLPNMSVWVGLGSAFWSTWHYGPLTFAFTLSDGTHTLKFSRTINMTAANSTGTPTFRRVTAPIPQTSATFNYAAVTGYTIVVSNRGSGGLRFTNLYLDDVAANPPSVPVPVAVRGWVYQVLGVQGTARAPVSLQFQQVTAPVLTTQMFSSPTGAFQWVAPVGVTSVKAECVGGGGAGDDPAAGNTGGGGGSGEYAAEAAAAVTPLTVYSGSIGAHGTFSPVANGGTTSITLDAVTVTAHPGTSATGAAGGTGGSGSANTTHHSGAAGGIGAAAINAGGGGASSGGSGVAGNAGATGASGGAGGAQVSGGGGGGKGGTLSPQAYGHFGAPGPGGGGGGGAQNPAGTNHMLPGNGGNGQVSLTYLAPSNFSTLICHRPGAGAPDNLCPFVTPTLGDTPDGTTEYPVPSLINGQTADFGGTYTVVAVAQAFNNPAAARSLTITVKQYEYLGGPSYSTSVTRNGFVPSADTTGVGGLNGIVVVGELTLPLKDVAPDNQSGYYTITITSSNTADLFLDVLFLDTMGATVIVNVPAAGAYSQMWIDEPAADVATGRVLGSDFDRTSAISVLDFAPVISGGPLTLQPGDNNLFVYCVEGAPGIGVTYYPRYYLDRVA